MAEYIEREAALMRLMQDGCSAKNVKSIMELPAAVSVLQWISVKDRLPKYENPVLAGNAELCFVNTAWYHVATKRWELPSGFFCEVTHWMPLPEPPKGENDG